MAKLILPWILLYVCLTSYDFVRSTVDVGKGTLKFWDDDWWSNSKYIFFKLTLHNFPYIKSEKQKHRIEWESLFQKAFLIAFLTLEWLKILIFTWNYLMYYMISFQSMGVFSYRNPNGNKILRLNLCSVFCCSLTAIPHCLLCLFLEEPFSVWLILILQPKDIPRNSHLCNWGQSQIHSAMLMEWFTSKHSKARYIPENEKQRFITY